ncbi:SDR family NAD(P)-dependent oxidoreductase [Zavarzinella formosa]|uniref:SDR family NAD(P)-dependent oxidoreductase n=1 Tax=Zavarzinella formosa TaxID=360055 RepID=UPI000305E4BB|nr:SDR family oxidoreductase [Zavarzinella formosa]
MNRIMKLAALGVGGYYAYRALKPKYDYRDRHVVITGGTRGLGLAMARRLASLGARLSVCSRNAGDVESAAAELRAAGATVHAAACDLTHAVNIRRFLEESRRLGPVDVLINNAGIIEVGSLQDLTIDDFERSLDTHFWAVYNACQEVLPQMRARNEGRIVNISSFGGKVAVPHLLPYSVGKFALVGFSEGLRSEVASEGVKVTTICPGLMMTGSHLNARFKGRHEEEYAWFALGNATPGLSMSADTAARRILAACAAGDSELVLGLPAKLAVIAQAICPNLMSGVATLVNDLVLPKPGGIGANSVAGRGSRRLVNPALTAVPDRAAVRNNETGGQPLSAIL